MDGLNFLYNIQRFEIPLKSDDNLNGKFFTTNFCSVLSFECIVAIFFHLVEIKPHRKTNFTHILLPRFSANLVNASAAPDILYEFISLNPDDLWIYILNSYLWREKKQNSCEKKKNYLMSEFITTMDMRRKRTKTTNFTAPYLFIRKYLAKSMRFMVGRGLFLSSNLTIFRQNVYKCFFFISDFIGVWTISDVYSVGKSSLLRFTCAPIHTHNAHRHSTYSVFSMAICKHSLTHKSFAHSYIERIIVRLNLHTWRCLLCFQQLLGFSTL